MKLRILLGATLILSFPRTSFALPEPTTPEEVLAQAEKLHYSQAKILLLDSIAWLEKRVAQEKDKAAKIKLQNSVADMYYKLGVQAEWDWDDDIASIAYFEKAYATDKKHRQHEAFRDLFAIAEGYYGLEQYRKSSHAAESALTLAIKMKNKQRQGEALSLLTVRFYGTERGIAYSERNVSISREEKWTSWEVIQLPELAKQYLIKKRFIKAIACYQRVLSFWEERNERELQIQPLFDIGKTYYKQKQYEKSLPYFERALRLSLEPQNLVRSSEILHWMGFVYQHLKQGEKAIEILERSRADYEAIIDPNRKAEANVGILLDLINLYKQQKQPEAAMQRTRQAINLLQSIRAEIGYAPARQEFVEGYQHVYVRAAQLFIANHRPQDAAEVERRLNGDIVSSLPETN